MVFLSTLVFSAVGGACSVPFTHVHVYMPSYMRRLWAMLYACVTGLRVTLLRAILQCVL